MRFSSAFRENEKAALKTALLASDAIAIRHAATTLSNPMAQAILERLKQDSIDVQDLTKDWVLKDELSFDDKRKLASYVYQYGNSQIGLSSGAPEKTSCKFRPEFFSEGEETPLNDANTQWKLTARLAQMAHTGERLLAFGYHRFSADSGKEEH